MQKGKGAELKVSVSFLCLARFNAGNTSPLLDLSYFNQQGGGIQEIIN